MSQETLDFPPTVATIGEVLVYLRARGRTGANASGQSKNLRLGQFSRRRARPHRGGSAIAQMELEHYPGMTEKALSALVDQAKLRWQIFDALVIHRIGPLLPLD